MIRNLTQRITLCHILRNYKKKSAGKFVKGCQMQRSSRTWVFFPIPVSQVQRLMLPLVAPESSKGCAFCQHEAHTCTTHTEDANAVRHKEQQSCLYQHCVNTTSSHINRVKDIPVLLLLISRGLPVRRTYTLNIHDNHKFTSSSHLIFVPGPQVPPPGHQLSPWDSPGAGLSYSPTSLASVKFTSKLDTQARKQGDTENSSKQDFVR